MCPHRKKKGEKRKKKETLCLQREIELIKVSASFVSKRTLIDFLPSKNCCLISKTVNSEGVQCCSGLEITFGVCCFLAIKIIILFHYYYCEPKSIKRRQNNRVEARAIVWWRISSHRPSPTLPNTPPPPRGGKKNLSKK